MPLQFITGTAGYDHRAKLLADLQQQLSARPDDRFFYLVPNHIKFDSEVGVLAGLADLNQQQQAYAQTRLQVFSFTRLAWFLMKNEPAYQIPRLSSAGISMLLYRILTANAQQLKLYNGEKTQPGFIEQLARELNELQQANLTPEDLQQLAANAPAGDLKAKLQDLSLVYEEFIKQTNDKYLCNNDLIAQLTSFLGTQQLQHTHVYLAGFSQLSAQEQGLITRFLDQGADVKIALTVDHSYAKSKPVADSLFYQAGRLSYRLCQYAQLRQIPCLPDLVAEQPRVQPDLIKLDHFWQRRQQRPSVAQLSQSAAIQIFQADQRQTELEQVARQIRQLVSTGQYRYRDFVILSRHLSPYQTLIEPTFRQFQIPTFVDLDKSMADHPFAELISALFALDQYHYRYSDVMRVLRTELIMPKQDNGEPLDRQVYRQAVDLTENFVLKTGITGHRWLSEDDWQYYRFTSGDDQLISESDQAISDQINLIHHFVAKTFPPLFEQLKAAENGQQAVTALYQFLVKVGVPQRLLAWRDQALTKGEVAMAAEPEQIWQQFCNLLDEFVTILGTEKFAISDFLNLLTAGFQGANFSRIPSTLDQVLISESGITQNQTRKVVFLIGATDLVMPDRITNDNLLSDTDKERLNDELANGEGNQYLGDSAQVQMAAENYLNYTAFLTGTDRLILSAPLRDSNGNDLQLSTYVQAIQRHFQLKVHQYLSTPDPTATKIAPYVGSKPSIMSHLVQVYRDVLTYNQDAMHRSEPMRPAPVWVWLRNWLSRDPQFGASAQLALAGLNYRNVPVQLTQSAVKALYGTEIYTSVSKLENYYRNPYEYFLRYGLKLQERDVFQLSAANRGEFYHAALDQFMKQVKGQDLAKLTLPQIQSTVTEVTEQILKDPAFAILQSSARMNYLRRQLVATVQQMAIAIHHQSLRSAARPLGTEIQFGTVQGKTGLRGLDFELSEQRKVHVRGKIDRLDQIMVDQRPYLGIVDYKSGTKDFSYQDAYYGLAMQMLTYLDAVLQNRQALIDTPDASLAGAVYMHIQNPIIKANALKTTFEEAVLKANKYQGLLVSEPQLLDRLDTVAQEKQTFSNVYPFRVTKAGYSKSDRLVTPNQLELLIQHDEDLIKAAAEAIFAGRLDLLPVRWSDQQTALQYTPYAAIMQFDAMLPENNYHQLAPIKAAEFFERVAKKGPTDK